MKNRSLWSDEWAAKFEEHVQVFLEAGFSPRQARRAALHHMWAWLRKQGATHWTKKDVKELVGW